MLAVGESNQLRVDDKLTDFFENLLAHVVGGCCVVVRLRSLEFSHVFEFSHFLCFCAWFNQYGQPDILRRDRYCNRTQGDLLMTFCCMNLLQQN